MAWTREFDRTYQTHYWYDAATGESSWTEPPGWSEPSATAPNPETDRLVVGDDAKDEELELVDRGPRRRASQDDTESDSDDEMLPASRIDAQARKVHSETEPVMRTWRCCFYFHANCCEGPCAALEAFLRAPFYIIAGVLCFWRPRVGYRLVREGLLFAALGITLVLPGAVACGVYGDHAVDKDAWTMRPVCTVCGCVDARRLFSLTCGQGSLAKNVTFNASDDSQDCWPGGIAHPPLKYWRRAARAFSRAEAACSAALWWCVTEGGHAAVHYGREGFDWVRDYFRSDGGRWRRAPSRDFPAAFSPEKRPGVHGGLESVVELV